VDVPQLLQLCYCYCNKSVRNAINSAASICRPKNEMCEALIDN
jgi:hypothetical protein